MIPNPSDAFIKETSAKSAIFLHTMIDEHFGISIVEMMAAGLVPVCHRSGGPELDIVENPGKLCADRREFVDCIADILKCSKEHLLHLKLQCQNIAVEKFADSGMRRVADMLREKAN